MIFKIFLWMFILALFHAFQETQIEGKNGWARHLPTFRIDVFLTKLLIGKEITGYHIFLLAMYLTIFHGIFLFQSWNWKLEASIFGYFSLYFVMEDFLFFIVNPHYTLKNFCKGKIEWHQRWFWGLPISYWWAIIIGIALLIIGGTHA